MLIACDSSGESNSEWERDFLVVGTIWVPKKEVPKYFSRMAEMRLSYKSFWGELEWKRYSRQADGIYREFMKVTLEEFPSIMFKTMIIRKNPFLLKKYHKGDETKRLSVAHNTLLGNKVQQFIRRNSGTKFQIAIDTGESMQPHILKLRGFIEYNLTKRGFDQCIENINQADSRSLWPLQACDIVNGAISAAWNRRDTMEEDKKNYLEYLESLFGHNFSEPTSFGSSTKRLDIWRQYPKCDQCPKLITDDNIPSDLCLACRT